MLSILSKFWWSIVLRGVLFLSFGIIAVSSQAMIPETLISYLGFMEIGIGITILIVSVLLRKKLSVWYLILLTSFFDLFIGGYIVFNSVVAAEYFTIVIAVWALIMGLTQFILSIRPGPLRIFLFINGLLAGAFAAIIYFNPFSGSNVLNFIIGFFTILFSIFLIYIGVKMRTLVNPEVDSKPDTSATD
jgi:uncharacterized membrane protein HdeD (DUF308 family)